MRCIDFWKCAYKGYFFIYLVFKAQLSWKYLIEKWSPFCLVFVVLWTQKNKQASNKFNLCNEKSLTNILFPCCCSAQVFPLPYYVCCFHSQWGKSPASFSAFVAAQISTTTQLYLFIIGSFKWKIWFLKSYEIYCLPKLFATLK